MRYRLLKSRANSKAQDHSVSIVEKLPSLPHKTDEHSEKVTQASLPTLQEAGVRNKSSILAYITSLCFLNEYFHGSRSGCGGPSILAICWVAHKELQ